MRCVCGQLGRIRKGLRPANLPVSSWVWESTVQIADAPWFVGGALALAGGAGPASAPACDQEAAEKGETHSVAHSRMEPRCDFPMSRQTRDTRRGEKEARDELLTRRIRHRACRSCLRQRRPSRGTLRSAMRGSAMRMRAPSDMVTHRRHQAERSTTGCRGNLDLEVRARRAVDVEREAIRKHAMSIVGRARPKGEKTRRRTSPCRCCSQSQLMSR